MPLSAAPAPRSESRAYSVIISSASASVSRPASFSLAERPVRSNSAKPSSVSSRCICALTADWVRPMRAPAPENVPYWLTAIKVLSSLSIVD
jgi:hypothetical protein